MSYLTSPYNHPEEQFKRLHRMRPDYDKRQTVITDNSGLWFVGAFILLIYAWMFYYAHFWLAFIVFFLGAVALIGTPLFRLMMVRGSPPHDKESRVVIMVSRTMDLRPLRPAEYARL